MSRIKAKKFLWKLNNFYLPVTNKQLRICISDVI